MRHEFTFEDKEVLALMDALCTAGDAARQDQRFQAAAFAYRAAALFAGRIRKDGLRAAYLEAGAECQAEDYL